MEESTLPRELQLIIDDIVEQNVHLLEWEVFGNTTEDMRVVLTWRRIEAAKAGEIQKSRWRISKQFGDQNDEDDTDDYVEEYWGDGNKWDVQSPNQSKAGRDDKENERKKKEMEEESRRKQKELEDKENERKRKELEEGERKRKQKELEDKEKEKKRKELEKQEKIKKQKALKDKENERKKKEAEEEERRRKQKQLEDEEKERKRKEMEEEERRRKQKQLEDEEKERKRKEIEEEERRRKQKELEDKEKERKRKELEDEEKRRKKREFEEQEYNRKKKELKDKENEKKLKQLENEENRRKKKELEDQENRRKKREFEEQEYSKRKKELEDAENRRNAKELEDAENRRIAKALEDDENRRKAKELEDEKKRKKKTGLKDNDADDFVDLNHKKPRSKEHAMRMLQMQRTKLSMSIDTANLDDDEMKKRFPDGTPGTGNGNSRNGKAMDTDLSGAYGGSAINFSFDAGQIQSGYDIEYGGSTYKSSKIKRYKVKTPSSVYTSKTRIGAPVIRVISQTFDTKGWQGCVDCQYNDFCDRPTHKDEYMHMLFEDAKNEIDHPINQQLLEGCECNVCTGGAVHNGCFYRELLRLKSEYLVFDKYNYCFCSECIPFKYRRICLRRELVLLRAEEEDHYYRLTCHDDDDGIIRHQLLWSDDSNYGSDEEDQNYEEGKFQAILLDDIPLKITKDDKISFRDCPDCQCNGFCDNIRHKKIYQMLLQIDDEDFDELEEECWCLVCEFKGAAHSGCAEREIRRLKYDLLLFDTRNLCYCHECVPFKYRRACLRQEMKKKRRGRRGEDLYSLL